MASLSSATTAATRLSYTSSVSLRRLISLPLSSLPRIKRSIFFTKAATFICFIMGNVVGSVFSGLSQIVGNILGHPLDFLSGKDCNTVCASKWDLMCYIENFCVAHLLKFLMAGTLLYFVLLFFYLLYNLGICQCLCHTLCRIVWACFGTFFSALHFCCTFVCFKLRTVKRRRRRRKRDIEAFAATSSEEDYESRETCVLQEPRNLGHRRSKLCKRRNYKHEHLRRSLRPINSFQSRVELSGTSTHQHRKKILKNIGDHTSPVHHHIRVTRSSKFLQKKPSRKTGIHRRKR